MVVVGICRGQGPRKIGQDAQAGICFAEFPWLGIVAVGRKGCVMHHPGERVWIALRPQCRDGGIMVRLSHHPVGAARHCGSSTGNQ